MSVIAYLGLGSNLGDRQDNLDQAVLYLRSTTGIEILRRSSTYETAPVGGPQGQEPYLNEVVEIATTMTARDLLERLLAIETRLGRVRQERFGPRTLDLDLLLYGSEVIEDPDLIVPHPRLHERLFVLEPLHELASMLVHPKLQRTVAELRFALSGVRIAGSGPGKDLAGMRALVTGSTSGIGRAIARRLSQAGADVLVHGRRSAEAASRLADELRRQGSQSAWLLADLRQPAACEQLAAQAWEQWDGIDILVNNAGTDTLTGEGPTWSYERKLEELWAVDVRATMLLSRSLGQRMKEAGHGIIINIGWDQAETGMEGDSGELFAAVKGAVMSFTRSLALSLAPKVRVHCVAPGWIKTAWGENASQIWQDRVRRETPLQVWGRPEDIAEMVGWLVSPRAEYMTGQILRVNGGAVR